MDEKTTSKILRKVLSLKDGYINNNNVKHLTDYNPKYRLRVGERKKLSSPFLINKGSYPLFPQKDGHFIS